MDDLKQDILNHFAGGFEPFYKHYLRRDLTKTSNNDLKCLCPFHEDKIPSFTFNQKTGTWYCHAEKVGGDLFSFYSRKHGLNTKTDFQQILAGIAGDFGVDNGPGKKSRLGKIAATYDYTDPEGKLLFQVCRMEPKNFKQRQPNGNGGWTWNLKGVERVLYRLPQVMKAKEVMVVEGEKDADALVSLGFTATTCPMGAKKWNPEYNNSLKGKHIVLLSDNDNEGREHMAQVGASLSLDGKSASLKLLELPGLPDKGDVSNWIAGFTNKTEASEKLSILVENAEPWRPAKEQKADKTDETIGQLISLNQVQPQRLGDLLATQFPEPIPLVAGMLNEEEVTVFAGAKKRGKTMFAQNLGLCIANGSGFLGFHVPGPQRVLYIQQEVPPRWFKERLEHMITALPEGPAKENFFHVSRREVLLTDKTIKIVRTWIEQVNPKLLILDPLYLFHAGEENSARDMTNFFRPVFKLVQDYRVSVWIVHHHGKPSQLLANYEDLDKSRGSSVIGGATDANIAMTQVPPKKYKLDGPRASYAVLGFEFRNLEPRDEIVIYRNPETRFYELVDVALAKKVTAQDVLSYVTDYRPILRKDLVEALQNEYQVSRNTVIHAIEEALTLEKIVKRKLETKGRPVEYLLPEDVTGTLF